MPHHTHLDGKVAYEPSGAHVMERLGKTTNEIGFMMVSEIMHVAARKLFVASGWQAPAAAHSDGVMASSAAIRNERCC